MAGIFKFAQFLRDVIAPCINCNRTKSGRRPTAKEGMKRSGRVVILCTCMLAVTACEEPQKTQDASQSLPASQLNSSPPSRVDQASEAARKAGETLGRAYGAAKQATGEAYEATKAATQDAREAVEDTLQRAGEATADAMNRGADAIDEQVDALENSQSSSVNSGPSGD